MQISPFTIASEWLQYLEIAPKASEQEKYSMCHVESLDRDRIA